MTTISGFDIPAGLEDLWNKIFQFGDNTTQTKLNLKNTCAVRTAKQRRNSVSLFVKWQVTYDTLTLGQKLAWTSYWGTLPFGSHVGKSGWPGSGFSAFVYVNAPRFKKGLALLLDPPNPNLLKDFYFTEGEKYWSAGDNWHLHTGYACMEAGEGDFGSWLWQNVYPLTNGVSYRVTFSLRIPVLNFDGSGDSSVSFRVHVGTDDADGEHFDDLHFDDFGWVSVTFTRICGQEEGLLDGAFYIETVSADVLDGSTVDFKDFYLTLG